jgi:hypothetical protein
MAIHTRRPDRFARCRMCVSAAQCRVMSFSSSRLAERLESRTLFALTTFTIDSTLSSLKLSGNVADVFDIEEQHSGSLNQFYQGTIVADLSDNVISFPGDSSVVAQATKKYDPGSDLANYGMKGETGGPFSVKLGEAAVRNFAFDLTSTDLALSESGAFGAGGLRVHTTGGKLDYDLRVGGDGSSDLDDKTPDNNATGNATLRGEGDNRTLTLPVDFTFDAGSTELRFRGTLVATSGSGAPVDPNDVRIGAGTLLKTVQFTDGDGTLTTVTIAGGGTADVRFENAGQQAPGKTGVTIVGGQNVALTAIDVTGSTPRTKLTITGKGGDGVVTVPALTTDGPAASVGGKGAAFTGAVTVGGTLGTLSASRLTSATVTAESLGAMKISGDVTNSTVTLDTPATAGVLTVRSVSVAGAFTGSRITSAGAIGPVKVKTMSGSEIYSGVADAAARFPAPSDLAATGAVGNVTAKTFADSVIAGHVLGRLKFGQIVTANNATPFGLTADVLGGLTAANESKQKLKLTLTDDPAVLTAELAAQSFVQGDFVISLA